MITTYINKQRRTSGIVAIFTLAFIFSIFGIFSRYLNDNFSVFQQMYLRTFAALLLSFIIFYKDLRFTRLFALPKKEWGILTLRAIFLYGFAATINILAFTTTTYSNVSFLGAIPTTALLGFLFLQEKITIRKTLIILLAFIGIILISSKELSQAFIWGKGEIYALIADVFFSLFYISRKWHANYLNNKELTFMILLLGSFLLFALSLIFDRSLPVTGWEMNYVYVIGFVAILTVANQFLINYGFQYVEPFLANNIIALESIFALFIGLLLYKENPTIQALIGGFLIMLSVPLMNREEEKKPA